MDNTMPTTWWKMMLGGSALAVFNVFAYMHLDTASGPVAVWGPVKAFYGAFGPDRVMTGLSALAVLFMLAALLEKVRTREGDDFHRPDPRIEPREHKPLHWVETDRD